MRRKYVIILVLFLIIGFASISTSLVINGIIGIGTKKDDFDVYFSGSILDNDDVTNEVIKSKKEINYSSRKLINVGEESELIYEVTNGSKQYDAEVTITCGIEDNENTYVEESEYIKILEYTNYLEIEAGKIKNGNIKVKLRKAAVEDKSVNVKCRLEAKAKERTSYGSEVEPHGEYSISGYFVNEEGNPVSNGYLAVYSDILHVVKTDIYGYFYVDGLERGMHEIYYLNTINPTELTKEEVKRQASGKVKVATNNEKEIEFTNKHKIIESVVEKEREEEGYTITLNADGGVLETTIKEVRKNRLYGELPIPEKLGYNFNGWYKNEKLINEEVYVVDDEEHTLKAKWSANKYIITLNANGGSLSEEEITKEVTYNTNYGKLPVPKREGYTFNGWYKEEELINKIEETTKYTDASNITIYAKWTPIRYNITINLNGGSATNEESYTPESNTITLNNPSKTGYTFTGWTGSNGTTPETNVSITKGSIGNKEYTANYTPINYTVTYDGNGSTSGSTGNSTHTYDEAASLTANGYQRKYGVTFDYNYTNGGSEVRTATYTFNGWTYNGNTYTNNQSVINLTTTNGTTVTMSANWNSGSVTLPTPTRSGYTFDGWYTEATGGSKINGTTYTPTGITTLYAHWTAINYSITTNLNGGSATNETSYTIESNTITLNNPSKTGYTFTGWTGSNGTTLETSVSITKGSIGNKEYTANYTPINYTVTYDGNGGTSGTTGNSTHTYDVAKNLTANGYQRKYNVTFNYNYTNGGSEVRTAIYTFNGWTYNGNTYVDKQSVSNLTTTNGATITMSANWNSGSVSLPNPTRNNHEFTGWYTEAGGGSQINGTTYTPTGTTTLYAHWQQVTAPVITGGSGGSWIHYFPTISISSNGTAASGVSYYEYYHTTSNVAPSNDSAASGIVPSDGRIVVYNQGTTYIYYRTVSKNGVRSVWSNVQQMNIDTTNPSVSLNSSLPSMMTVGTNYAILGSYSTSGASGGSVSCTSNRSGSVSWTNALDRGTHLVSCYASSGAGLVAVASKYITVVNADYYKDSNSLLVTFDFGGDDKRHFHKTNSVPAIAVFLTYYNVSQDTMWSGPVLVSTDPAGTYYEVSGNYSFQSRGYATFTRDGQTYYISLFSAFYPAGSPTSQRNIPTYNGGTKYTEDDVARIGREILNLAS